MEPLESSPFDRPADPFDRPAPEQPEYKIDPTLEEEITESLVKDDPRMIWGLTSLLASMDEETYQIHRAAIKLRFGSRIVLTGLDRAVAEKRNEMPEPPDSEGKTPPNDIANLILRTNDMLNVRDNLYRYDGVKWVITGTSHLRQLAIKADGETTSTAHRRTEIVDFIKSKIYQDAHEWRQIEMYEIPVANGVIDIRDMSIRRHRKEDYIQTCIPWEFDHLADSPVLSDCLETYFGSDDDCHAKVDALQEFFGYCLMPHARYKKALLCLGESDCGKSTVPFLLRTLLGHENIAAVGVEHMDDSRKRAPLLGKLVNLLTELTSDAMIADGGFKTLVSTEEPIEFDPKFETPVMEIPICKHVIVTNTKPRIGDRSNATYRRLLLIHFNHVIAEADQNTSIWDRLKEEVPGILTWALRGAARLYASGGSFTDPGAEEVKEYRKEQNPIGSFLEDCCELDPTARTKCTSVVERFRSYSGGRWTPQQIVGLLRQSGFEVSPNPIAIDGQRTRCVFGLRLVG